MMSARLDEATLDRVVRRFMPRIRADVMRRCRSYEDMANSHVMRFIIAEDIRTEYARETGALPAGFASCRR